MQFWSTNLIGMTRFFQLDQQLNKNTAATNKNLKSPFHLYHQNFVTKTDQ